MQSGTNNNLNCVKIIGNNFFITGVWGTIITGNIVTSVNEKTKIYPIQFVLAQNYPNPFNPTTRIRYSIPHLEKVVLKVYDILGKEIATLVNEEKAAGNYEVKFDGSKLSSGVYFYQMRAGDFIETKKFVLIK